MPLVFYLLQRIENLFLDLLKFVFHLHHDVLHLGVIAFRTRRVDLTPHLLCDETELFTLCLFFFHRLAEIAQMIGKSLLLFADI